MKLDFMNKETLKKAIELVELDMKEENHFTTTGRIGKAGTAGSAWVIEKMREGLLNGDHNSTFDTDTWRFSSIDVVKGCEQPEWLEEKMEEINMTEGRKERARIVFGAKDRTRSNWLRSLVVFNTQGSRDYFIHGARECVSSFSEVIEFLEIVDFVQDK